MQAVKPGSVVSYHLSCPAVTRGNQTTYPFRHSFYGIRASNSALDGTYLVFQPIRFTPILHRCKTSELLPHFFTLTSCEAVIFCGTVCPFIAVL